MRIFLAICFVLVLVGGVFYEQKISSNIDPGLKSLSLESNPGSVFPGQCDWLGFGRVVDGDTIIVFDADGQVRVRMIGVDTPESKKEGTPIQDYALESSRVLKNLIGSPEQVCLIQDTIGDQSDIYDRRLSYVYTEAGIDLNAEMLRRGWAKAYLRFPFDRKPEFKTLEATAKESRVGRWE